MGVSKNIVVGACGLMLAAGSAFAQSRGATTDDGQSRGGSGTSERSGPGGGITVQKTTRVGATGGRSLGTVGEDHDGHYQEQKKAPEWIMLPFVANDHQGQNLLGSTERYTKGFGVLSPVGHVVGMVENELGPNGVPVLASKSKWRQVGAQARDAEGRMIVPNPMSVPALYKPYIRSRPGDVAATLETFSQSRLDQYAFDAADFARWFTSAPGYAVAVGPLNAKLKRASDRTAYTYSVDSEQDRAPLDLAHPIDGLGFGNQGRDHNYYYSLVFTGEVLFRGDGSKEVLKVRADDSCFVFINDKLVIDMGGAHQAVTQEIDLGRLTFAYPGHKLEVKIFRADQHPDTQSSLAISMSQPWIVGARPMTGDRVD